MTPRLALSTSASTRSAIDLGTGSAQSIESTVHIMERSLSASTVLSLASLRAPYGKRKRVDCGRPVASSSASVSLASTRTASSVILAIMPWLKLWLASTWPAASTRLAAAPVALSWALPCASSLPRLRPSWKKMAGAS
ncbi:hypothetical protein D3C72_1492710 [compost metagenome]